MQNNNNNYNLFWKVKFQNGGIDKYHSSLWIHIHNRIDNRVFSGWMSMAYQKSGEIAICYSRDVVWRNQHKWVFKPSDLTHMLAYFCYCLYLVFAALT